MSLIAFVIAAAFSSVPLEAGSKGDEICYLRETDGIWQVWTMNGKGRKHTRVTESALDKVRCTWTGRAGELLATTASGEVLRVAPGEEERPINLGDDITDAVALPDNRGIVYAMRGAGIDTDDLWISLSGGDGPVRITREPYLEHSPAPCPDGKTLIYLGGRGGDHHDIFKTWLDPSRRFESEKLTLNQLYNFEPSCSRSGRIAFSSNRGGDTDYDIWMMEADGSNTRQLTDHPGPDTHPTWSPDERSVAFESRRDGEPAIYRLDLKKAAVHRLTPEGARCRAPEWRR